jgi:hypothetical protein
MSENLQELLKIIEGGFNSDNKSLNAARERKFTRFTNDRQTTILYERAIDFEVDRQDFPKAALIATEAGQYSKAIEIYQSINAWEDAAFVAKIAGNCELAHKLYKKAGNEFYAQRMQENLRAKSA